MVHTSNPNTQELEMGGSEVQYCPGAKKRIQLYETLSQTKKKKNPQ